MTSAAKLEAYRTIPSLEEYIIVSHRERRVVVHRRRGDRFTSRVAITAGTVRVESLDTELHVDELYRRSSIGS